MFFPNGRTEGSSRSLSDLCLALTEGQVEPTAQMETIMRDVDFRIVASYHLTEQDADERVRKLRLMIFLYAHMFAF